MMMRQRIHSKFAWILSCVSLLVQIHGTDSNDPWNQPGSNVNPGNPVAGDGGTLQPQRSTTATRRPTTTSQNTTPSNSTEVLSTNSTEISNNTTTITPSTNIDLDGLTEGTKIPTSVKPEPKILTTDSSLVSPDAAILNIATTQQMISSSTENVTNAGTTVVPSVDTSTNVTSSDTTTNTVNVTSQVMTTRPVYSSRSPETTLMVSDPAVTSNVTDVIDLVTTHSVQQETSLQDTTGNLSTSTSAARIPASTQSSSKPLTPNHSTSMPFQRTTIPITQVQLTSTDVNQTPISMHSTTPAETAPRTNGISTGKTSTVLSSTQSPMHSQTSSVVVTVSPHRTQHRDRKLTKQPGMRPGPSARSATAEPGPIEGDQNDRKSAAHSAAPKDSSDNENIPIINRPSGQNATSAINQSLIVPPYPPAYIQLTLMMSSFSFCNQRNDIQLNLVKVANDVAHSFSDVHAGLLNVESICDHGSVSATDVPHDAFVSLDFYFTAGEMYDADTTRIVGDALEDNPRLLSKYLTVQVTAVKVYNIYEHGAVKDVDVLSIEISVPLGLVLLIIVAVGGFVLYKIYKLRVARKTYQDRYYFDGKQLHDSMSDKQKLNPKESKAAARRNLLVPAINQALELDEPEDIALQVFPSHILSINALAKFYTYIEAIVQEFQTLPDFQAILRNANKAPPSPLSPKRLAATLPGHQLFERHHHVHSFQSPTKTQVKLENVELTVTAGHLNANFVIGYNESSYTYIACQAPDIQADDFWQMVWEQQSKTIILLCAPEEMGMRCLWYWPKDIGIQSAQLYGNILVMLQGQVRTENYIMSTLLIKDIQRNLCRPVTHCWFCQWPEMEIPINPRALVVFLLQVRQTYQENPGPIVVQCSDGCGRTGTLLAIDTCMQSLEDAHSVDIPSTVSNIRQDRGSAVHNREQYSFIYKVLFEYSTMLIASGSPETNFVAQPSTTQSMPLSFMSQ